jgi:uncharacterized protein YggT (Ycf19 family)
MAIQSAMTVRAILSWIPMESNKITDFLFSLTEPFIYPIRRLFQRLNWFQGMPIDLSFLFAYILLSVLSSVLAA